MENAAFGHESVLNIREMENICRLWIAVSHAKDGMIQEMAAENSQLKQRVARLSRMIGRRARSSIACAKQSQS